MQGLRGRGAGRGGGRGAPPGRGRGGGREAANGGCLYSTGGASSAGRGGGGRGPLTREEKKEGRRQKQANAIAAREAAEDQYFKQCQREAHKSGEAQRAKEGLAGRDADAREKALFATQGTQGIQFDKYANIKVECRGPGSDAAPPLDDFGALTSLPPFLARNIGLMNYVKPTPIQRHAVPLALAGVDLMCCAQTGSGKTAAFLVPVCTALANTAASGASTVGVEGSAKPRAVVMAPTRELASQIELEAQKLTNRSPLRPVAVYGGADQRAQARALAVGVDIVVATPGRLNDFVERGLVELGRTVYLVLDEADRMLDMGFEPQIRRIVRVMPPPAQRHTLLFSATFPETIQKLAKEFLRPYVWIAVGRVGSTVEGITQRIWQAAADKRQKLGLVVKALAERDGRTLVFVEKKRSATWLKKMLRNGGASDAPPAERFTPVAAEDIHGDRSQSQREAALAAFRSGSCRVLVATDVAARGLDVPGVEHVINMDLPFARDDFDSYVHRIGRTGRAGHTGLATSLFVPGEAPKQGNGRIAPLLATLLKEAGQAVPPFLAGGGGGGGGGGGRGGAMASHDGRGTGHGAESARRPPPAAPPTAAPEMRTAPDGKRYTKREFQQFFGGFNEWDDADPNPPRPAAAGGRGGGGGGRGRGRGGLRGRGR